MNFTREIDVNEYSLLLLHSMKFLKSEYRKYIDNSYSLTEKAGTLSPDVLQMLLKSARRNRHLRVILSELLWYADADSVTDANFRAILHFPKQHRNNYIAVLGHHRLAFYQMQILNRYPQSYEVFSNLFDCVCKHDCFTDKDMLQLLERNCDTTRAGIKYCIDYAKTEYGDSKKLTVASEWLEQSTSKSHKNVKNF